MLGPLKGFSYLKQPGRATLFFAGVPNKTKAGPESKKSTHARPNRHDFRGISQSHLVLMCICFAPCITHYWGVSTWLALTKRSRSPKPRAKRIHKKPSVIGLMSKLKLSSTPRWAFIAARCWARLILDRRRDLNHQDLIKTITRSPTHFSLSESRAVQHRKSGHSANLS